MSERPTYNQIEEQNHKGSYPTVLVERNNGESISTGTYEGVHPVTGDYLVGVDGGVNVKSVKAEALTDEHQASLAEKLAGKPLLQAEMGHSAVTSTVEVRAQQETAAEVSAAIDALIEHLSAEDKRRLHSYFIHREDKLSAQRANNGRASELSGQYAGQEHRAMSREAQAVESTYVALMSKLSRIRDLEA